MTAPARTARGVRGRRNRFHQAGEGRWRRGNSLWQKEAKKLRGGLLTLGRTLGRAELQSSNDLQTPPLTRVISKGHHPAPQPGPSSIWRPRSRGSSSPDTAESNGGACLLPAWPACKAPTTSQLTGQSHCFKKQHLGKFSSTGEDLNRPWSCCPSAVDQRGLATDAALAGGEILHLPAQTP